MGLHTLLAVTLAASVAFQDDAAVVARDLPGADVVVALKPGTGRGPAWSPKAATVALESCDEGLEGRFRLGPEVERQGPIRVVLARRAPDAPSLDELGIDLDRDGAIERDERFATEVNLRRDKYWSSWSATVTVRSEAPDGAVREQAYPMDLWYVLDPAEPDAAPALRWSRRGWMHGEARTGDSAFHVALAEMVMDGVYDRRDRWILAEDASGIASTKYRGGDDHAWLGERAWRIVSVHPSGLQVTLRRFDPGISRDEEERARDRYAADRAAPRAAQPLAFDHDFAAAEAESRRMGRPLFIDFETTWCGPCKQMDAMVYTAQAVVGAAAASNLVTVKVDGDEHRTLVQRFAVSGYPTMILLDAEGRELRRAVGYQSVEAMRSFLTVEE